VQDARTNYSSSNSSCKRNIRSTSTFTKATPGSTTIPLLGDEVRGAGSEAAAPSTININIHITRAAGSRGSTTIPLFGDEVRSAGGEARLAQAAELLRAQVYVGNQA
jgi:hypothetical protein